MTAPKCPAGWRPGCSCSVVGTEPREDCGIHGCPDWRRCEYCGQFVAWASGATCKRCGWTRGVWGAR